MSQIDNYKIARIRQKLAKRLNRRELCALMESLMEDTVYRSGSPEKQRAATSYMKIAHGRDWYFLQAWKNN